MRLVAVSIALVTLGACTPEPPPPPPSPAVPARPPEPPLPPLGEVRFRDWTEVDEETFLELPAPAEAPKLAWAFEPGSRLGYDFAESVAQKLEYAAQGKTTTGTTREKNRGTFEFVAGRDRTAAAIAKVQSVEAFVDDKPVDRATFEKQPPSVSEAVVSEDGTAEPKKSAGRADARFYFQALLALVPGERPLMGGKVTTRLAGFRKVRRYDCARIESEFEATTDRGSERHVLRGRIVGYFALAERRFVRASASVGTSSRTNAFVKEGAWLTTSIDALTRYRLTLLD